MSKAENPITRYVIRLCANGQHVVVAADMEWCYLPCAERRYASSLHAAKILVAMLALAQVAS